jgi:hypothetical protein
MIDETWSGPVASGLVAAGLLVLVSVAGCASAPDCSDGADNVIDEAFAPLDNAVGEVNQSINDEGSSGDCRIITSSEANAPPE